MKKLVLLLGVLVGALLIWQGQVRPAASIHGPIVTIDQQATRRFKVQWLAKEPVSFSYREQGGDSWRKISAASGRFPGTDRQVYRVVLRDLIPDRVYEMRIGDRLYKVRSLPDVFTSLRFAVGGDMMHEVEMLESTTRTLARHAPAFAVLGGDLAYANGKDAGRWYSFLDAWARTAVTEKGLTVPVIVAIGNHEVKGGYGQGPAQAPFFYALFDLPGKSSNYTVDVGQDLSFVVLDSDHTQRIGEQQAWLEQELAVRRHRPFLFPVYHFPAYGILKKGLANRKSQAIRRHWVPAFENNRVRVAFEHDHHVYKRSHRIRAERLDTDRGIAYIGDGAYGVRIRHLPENWSELWYVAQAASRRHFLLVTLEGSAIRVDAVGENGEMLDSYVDERVR